MLRRIFRAGKREIRATFTAEPPCSSLDFNLSSLLAQPLAPGPTYRMRIERPFQSQNALAPLRRQNLGIMADRESSD